MSTTSGPFFLSSVGKKYIMAVTGLIWAGFVFTHMAGNFLLFVSPNAYNSYGHALTSGNLIYVIEIILIISFLAHVFCAISLTKENRIKSNGGAGRYAMPTNGEKAVTRASKMMAVQGSLVLLFLITHISGFKFGTYYETTVNGVVMRDLYRLIFEVFHQPQYVFWYFVCLVLLGFHLSHGVGSTFQSLGLRNDRYAPLISKISLLYGLVVAGGFIAQPLYIFLIAK